MSTIREKKATIFFFNGNFAFFQKFLFLTTSQVLKKRSQKFHSKCHNNLWTPIYCFPRLITLDNTTTKWPNVFVMVERTIFLKSLFYRLLKVLKNWYYHFHSNCQKTFWTLIKFSLRLLIIENTRKSLQSLFFSEKIAFFSKTSVFDNVLGVTDMIS